MISAFLLCSSNQILIYQAEICGKGGGQGCSFLVSCLLGEEVLKENPKPSLTSTGNEDIDLSKLPPLNLMFPAPLWTVIVVICLAFDEYILGIMPASLYMLHIISQAPPWNGHYSHSHFFLERKIEAHKGYLFKVIRTIYQICLWNLNS